MTVLELGEELVGWSEYFELEIVDIQRFYDMWIIYAEASTHSARKTRRKQKAEAALRPRVKNMAFNEKEIL